MKYGEVYETISTDWSGRKYMDKFTYKRTEWHEYHTNDYGEGLWRGDKQLLGTCQFSVTGCQTENAAKAKIRNLVKKYYEEED